MTVAANQALVLRRLLAHSGANPAPSRYFRAIAKVVDPPWDIVLGADLAFPGVPGTRTAKIRRVNAYLRRFHAAAASDVTLGAAFVRVVGLLDRAEGLLRPDREPDTFDDAPFDITAQLTFGGGIHYCLGAWLARIEMREALPILATRLRDIELDGPVASRPHVGITGPITLPLRFTGSLR